MYKTYGSLVTLCFACTTPLNFSYTPNCKPLSKTLPPLSVTYRSLSWPWRLTNVRFKRQIKHIYSPIQTWRQIQVSLAKLPINHVMKQVGNKHSHMHKEVISHLVINLCMKGHHVQHKSQGMMGGLARKYLYGYFRNITKKSWPKPFVQPTNTLSYHHWPEGYKHCQPTHPQSDSKQ